MRSQRTEMATTKSNKWRNNRRQLPPKSKQSNSKQEWKCKRCGRQHQKPRECPAMNKICHKCGKNGHFTRACLAKNTKHRVQSIQADQEMERHEILKYEDSPATSYQASQIKVCAKVNQVKEPHEPPVDKKIVMVTVLYTRNHSNEFKDRIRMRVDTCADINIMPLSVYQTIFNDPKREKLMPTGIQVTTYNDSTLDLLGRCTLYLQHPKTHEKIAATFYVTQEEGSVLLSCSTSLKLEVIQVPEQGPVPVYMPIYTSSLDKPNFTDQYVIYQNEIIEIYNKQNPDRIIRSKQGIKRLYPLSIHRHWQIPRQTILNKTRP